MAFTVAGPQDVPQHTTVEYYTVRRLGRVPVIEVGYAETVDETETPCRITSVVDETTITLPVWGERTDLVGRVLLALVAGVWTPVGTISAVTPQESFPMGVEIVLADASSAPLLPAQKVTLHVINGHGEIAHRLAVGGRRWTAFLPLSGTEELARAQQMLVGVSLSVVSATLAALGTNAPTQDNVIAAVIQAASSGNDIDSILGSACEALELDRRAGNAAFLQIMGNAPIPAAS